MIARVLTVAGSDSGGGAGIQADLKTIHALGGFGMSAITALTAQNTQGVQAVIPVDPVFVATQIRCVHDDIGVDAIKVGMLFSVELIESVATCLRDLGVRSIVVDPVMVAKGGSRLLEPSATQALIEQVFPLAGMITPNIPEAEVLTGMRITSKAEMERAADQLLRSTRRLVLKGGHLGQSSPAADLFASAEGERFWVELPRVQSRNTHGTGCTYSAAIATRVAQGLGWEQAVRSARDFVQGAILGAAGWQMGRGNGPLDHGWQFRK